MILAAEWSKLRSVRGTWTTLAGGGILAIGMGAIMALTQVSRWDELSRAQQLEFDPTSGTLVGVLFTTTIIGALAVRSITSEHSTGMLGLTFTAMPRRATVIAAKALVVAALATATALVANLIAFTIGQGLLEQIGIGRSLADRGTWRAITFGALAVGLAAIVGVGLGALLRRTAAATTLLAITMVGSQLFNVIVPPAARPYVPGSALQATVTTGDRTDLLEPLAGLAALAGYAAVLLAAGIWRTSRRDA